MNPFSSFSMAFAVLICVLSVRVSMTYEFKPSSLMFARMAPLIFKMSTPNQNIDDLPLPPGRLGIPLLEDKTFSFAKEGSAYLSRMHNKYGEIFKQRLFFTEAIVVTGYENLKTLWLSEHDLVEAEVPSVFSPLLGEKGIFMTKGDAHRKLKQQLARGFSPTAVTGYLPSMQSLIEGFCNKWADQGSVLGVTAAKDMSFAVILEVVMGFERELWTSEEASARVRKLYAAVQAAMLAPPINLPGTTFRRALRARAELLVDIERSLLRVAAERGPTEEGRARSVAAILLSAVDEDGERLSMEQIKDVSFNMLDAGHETTACALASLLLSLADDPDALAALRAEQAAVAATHGPALTDAALRAMPFADAAIREALRNTSPAPADRMRAIAVNNVRRALRPFALGGFRIPAGYTVIGSLAHAAHTDPRWEGLDGTPLDKRRFCPARWLVPAAADSAPAPAPAAPAPAPAPAGGPDPFQPFGLGPRVCVGSALATAELRIALAVLARGYAWRRAGAGAGAPAPWKSDPFPYPSDGLPLEFTRLPRTA
jgi:retinoid hydroxylase